MSSDPLRDLTERIRKAMLENGQLTPAIESLLDEAERDVRRDWEGERVYFGKRTMQMLSERNRAIIREWMAGERQSYLARKYGISKQRVKQIIDELAERGSQEI